MDHTMPHARRTARLADERSLSGEPELEAATETISTPRRSLKDALADL